MKKWITSALALSTRRTVAALLLTWVSALAANETTTTDGGNTSCNNELPTSTCGGAAEISDVGTAPASRSSAPQTGGNPINLMTGNKFQRETDLLIPGAALSFNRLYNSANADSNIGLGQGWHHSYAVSLFDSGNGSREIVQSNGSRIRFTPDATNEEGQPLMRGSAPNYGYVVQTDTHHEWHLPDSRTLVFQGSYLVRIDWPDQRRLEMFYRAGRLHSVTDEIGRVLRLEYQAGVSKLKGFDVERFTVQAGHLASVTLPDGGIIEYDYDNNRNLTRARYPDGSNREYHYDNEIWPNHLTGITDRTGARFATWTYDDEGRGISSEHAGGVEKVTFRYPDPKAIAKGEVVQTQVTNSLGHTSQYTWQQPPGNPLPMLLSSTGAGCVTCPATGLKYSYDKLGRVVNRTHTGQGNAVGAGSIIYSYDEQSRHFESRTVNAVGVESLVERFEYENTTSLLPKRRYLPSVNPDTERTIETTYNARGQALTITEHGYSPVVSLTDNLAVNVTNFDSIHSSIDGFAPIERTTRLTYEEGRLIEIDGPRDDVEDITRFKWDKQQRLTEVIRPLSPTIRMSRFDTRGQAQQIQVGSGNPFLIERDGRGSVTAVTHRGERFGYQHDAEGRLISFSGPDGQQVTIDHDDAGRTTQIVDDVGRTSLQVHDSESRLIGQNLLGIDGATVRSLAYVFDAQGRMSESTEQRLQSNSGLGAGRSLSFQYDSDNQFISATDLISGASIQRDVDYLLRVTTLTQSDGVQHSAMTDELGRMIAMRDARYNTTAFLRDDFGRVVFYDNPDTGPEFYHYDKAGNRTERVREDGSVVTYMWDSAGRLIDMRSSTSKITSAAAVSDTTAWRYDPSNGQLLETNNSSGTELFSYNKDAQLESHTRLLDGKSFTTRYQYDSRGRQIRKELPDGQSLLFHYHTDGPNKGALQEITRPVLLGLSQQVLLGEIDLDNRDGTSGHLTQDGRRTEKTFSASGEIQSLSIDDTLTLNYTFDEMGRINGIEENGTAQTFAYSGTQLTSANMLSGDYRYQYDSQGNRIVSKSDLENGQRTSEHFRHADPGDGNRLIEQTDLLSGMMRSYRYDGNGAPTDTGLIKYDYNADGRPVAVYRGEQLIAQYSYNSFGARVKKVRYADDALPETTYFLYDGKTLAAEISGNGNIASQYVYLSANRPVLKLEGSEAYSIHTDHLGTPRIMTDKDSVVVWAATYSPFGEASISKNIVSLPLRLPGQYLDDETGTHYNYLRDYDPTTGRYLTSDPIGLNGGINTYAYASNNPVALFDVIGLAPEAEPLDGGGWRITAQQYSELAALAAEQSRVEYYFMLHSLTGSRLALEMAQISSNSEQVGGIAWNANYAILDENPGYPRDPATGDPSIRYFSELIFNADFNAISHFQCIGPNEASYRLPSDSEMIQVTVSTWASVGLEHVAPPLVREFLDFYGDLATQAALGAASLPFGAGNVFIPERYEESFAIVAEATVEEVTNANGFYEPEFIRDHPGAIETTFSEDCLSKMLRAPIESRDPSMSSDQVDLYDDVSGSQTHDVVVVLTNGSEYQSCIASQ